MTKTSITFLAFLFLQFSFAQSAEELNAQSKSLLQQRNYEEALPILKQAAELESGEAQYNLGNLILSGVTEDQNIEEAINWYRKSSENNFNDGHYAMMMAYGNGEGIEQDSEKAFQYAMKCANNDDSTCMWNIVNCYVTGNGVEQSIPKYKKWIFRLAKLQNPENLAQSGYITSARLELAHNYRDGQYFEKDIYESYLWYLIYNEFKFDFSILKQNEVIEEIQSIEKVLSEKQIKESKANAEKLLGRELNNIGELHKNSL